MSYVIQVVLSNARHPEYGQFTIPFPIPQDAYDDMVEALKNMEIGDPILQDCHVDELESSYSILKRLEKTNLNLDELDYLAKRLDSFDNGEAAQFQGMACKLGVSNIKDFINLTFCCQQATVITDFSDLDAIGRQHYMTMQGGGCRIEELERLDGRKFALDLILNHLEGRITPYGVVYDNGMKLEQLYDGRHFPCYHYQPNLLAVGLSSRQEPENTDQITWLLLPCSEQQLQRGIARSGVNIHDARIWYEDSLLPSEVEEVLEGQREDLFALNDMATAIAALSDLEQKKLTAVMEMAKPECAGEIRELAKNLELFEFAPKVRTPAEYGRYMIQDSGHYEYDPNLDEFYDYARYGKLRIRDKAVCALCGEKMARDTKSHGRPRWRCKNPECGGSVYLDDSIILERVVQKLKVLAHSPACIQLPKAAPASTDALRIENELALCFNRADINPEYMKTLIMAAAAERYAGLNDPTPAHRLALLRQKLELEPENEETLWELFESAVTHVCIGKGGEISLSQKDQKECAS